MTIIDREIFLNLPTEEIAKLVREVGKQVCVLPINGTRRWFTLEHAHELGDDPIQEYLDIGGKQYISVYSLCFEHGLDTLLTPDFGSELLTRGDIYMRKVAADGLERMTNHPDFLSFYEQYKVRVYFYGDYRKRLADTPFAYLLESFDKIAKDTAKNDRYRLFHGVFANDATETIAEYSIEYFQKTGNIPSRRELVEHYYGEYVEPVNLFVGFDKPSVFDYPLLNIGEENLYFTMAPSLYLNALQLRSILYDHLYLRRVEEADYTKMSKQQLKNMRDFYQDQIETILGVGQIIDGIWYPNTIHKKQL